MMRRVAYYWIGHQTPPMVSRNLRIHPLIPLTLIFVRRECSATSRDLVAFT